MMHQQGQVDGYTFYFKHIRTLSNILLIHFYLFVIFFVFLFWGQTISIEGQPEQPESLCAYHVSPPENQTLSNFTGKQYTTCKISIRESLRARTRYKALSRQLVS